MERCKRSRWPVAVAVGFVVGLVLTGFLPDTPLRAVSTDRCESFAIATGPVDSEVEAVYFLDFLTGDLTAIVLGKQPRTWSGFFQTNVAADLMLDPQKSPNLLMVTGVAGLRRSGGTRQQPSSAVCYVADVNSGKVVAYAVPWSPSMYSANQPQQGPLLLVGLPVPFRQGGGMGVGAAPSFEVPKAKDKKEKKEE